MNQKVRYETCRSVQNSQNKIQVKQYLRMFFLFIEKRLGKVLQTLGITLENLSKSGVLSLRTLSTAAVGLDLKVPKLSR